MIFVLWLVAVFLVVGGIVTMIKGQPLVGLAIVVVGFAVGPGGASLFT